MLFGSFSIPQLKEMYNDPYQRPLLRRYIFLLIFGAILWFSALFLLIYYWKMLEIWAKIIGVFGLLFNMGGSILTILVVFIGMKNIDLLPTTIEEKLSNVPLVTSQSPLPITSSTPFNPLKRSQTSVTLPIPSSINPTPTIPSETVPTTTIS